MNEGQPLPLPGPNENWLVWLNRNGDAAIERINLLSQLEIKFIAPSSTQGRYSILFSGQSAVMQVPLLFRRPIALSTASAASVSEKLNQLLEELRATGQLPPSP